MAGRGTQANTSAKCDSLPISRSDLALQMAFCRLRLSMGRESCAYRRALHFLRTPVVLVQRENDATAEDSTNGATSLHGAPSLGNAPCIDGAASLHGTPSLGNAPCLDGATVLCLSDGSFLPLLVARLNALRVLVVESNSSTKQVMERIINYNSQSDRNEWTDPNESTTSLSSTRSEPVKSRPDEYALDEPTRRLSDIISLYDSLEDIPEGTKQQVSLILGEPYFHFSSLPWHDLYFWYSAASLSATIQSRPNVLPCAGRLCCLALQFENLHRIRSPLVNKQGFDMRLYDDMIEEARQHTDDFTETHSLWEYPGIALGEPVEMCHFDFTIPPDAYGDRRETISLPINRPGELNGVAFWMEYDLSEKTSDRISSGLLEINASTHKAAWNKYHKQGVHLPATSSIVSSQSNVSIDFTFDCCNADVLLKLNVQPDSH